MTQCPAPPDLDVSDEEIERLRTKAAERTSTARNAYAAQLEAQALAKAVDPAGILDDAERAERAERLHGNLTAEQLEALVRRERKLIMSQLGAMSARARRLARINRLRRAAGEVAA